MNVSFKLATLGLRQLVAGACEAAGIKGADAVVGFLVNHFTDHSQKLSEALRRANERAWRALEVALAGTSWWDRVKGTIARGEDRAFRAQLRAFLDATPLGEGPNATAEFRQQCLRQLQAARKAGALTEGTLNPQELARQVGAFARFGDPQSLLDAEWRAVEEMADELRQADFSALARLLALRPPNGTPVLVAAVRYFFRREVETDPELFRGLSYTQVESLGQAQQAGFDALADALAQQGQRLEELLDVAQLVAETHETVLDVREEQRRQGDQGQAIYDAVIDLAQRFDLVRRELRAGDSLSIRSENERQLVKQLVARYRALPEEQRGQLPALLNALGKLEVVAGDFDAAQQDFQAVARMVPETRAQAEAHANAYQASLEQRNWPEALVCLRRACALDPERFAPFPLTKYEPERILGAGGFGVAFLCRNRRSGSRVVIKALRAEGLERDVAEVFREAQVLEELDHPAIIRLRDCDYADPAGESRPYLVMDYFDGATLEELVRQEGTLSAGDLVALAQIVGQALQTAHARRILHRDLKPANLLVKRVPGAQAVSGPRWQVKLIDFGLALQHSTLESTVSNLKGQGQTIVGSSVAGTLEYAAPEQLGKLPGVPVGPSSDVYGFARTCCYALFKTPQPRRQHWKSLPEPLAELLDGCMADTPAERPQDFTAVLARLAEIEKDSGQASEVFPEPKDAAGYQERGKVRQDRGDYDRAIADYTEAIRLNPASLWAYNNRALAYQNKGDYDRAIADCTEAIRLNPTIAWAYHSRGLAYYNKGDYDRGVADYAEAIRLDPQFALAYCYRGLAHARKGDPEKARADYEQGTRLDPRLARTFAP